jgi:hypothetical protein
LIFVGEDVLYQRLAKASRGCSKRSVNPPSRAPWHRQRVPDICCAAPALPRGTRTERS